MDKITRSTDNPSARRWMWAGVISVTAVIVALWGWSFLDQLSVINLKRSAEGQLAAGAGADWKKAFTESQAKQSNTDQLESARAQIKQMLKNLAARQASSTVVTSTQK